MKRTRAAARVGAALLSAGLVASLLGSVASAAVTRPANLPSPTTDVNAPNFAPPLSVQAASAWLGSALSARESATAGLASTVSTSTSLTTSDRAALTSLLASATSGIAALAQHAPSETSLTSLHNDAAAMIANYHVYVFLTPLVNRVVTIDAELATTRSLSTEASALEAAITAALVAKRNVAPANSVYKELKSKLTAINNRVGSLSSTLLAFSPQSWPAPKVALQSASTDTSKASTDIVAANADVSTIVRLLAQAGTRARVR